MKIAVFHHLYPANRWEMIFSEQMHRLCASGLYKAADHIHIGMNSADVRLPFYLEKIKVHNNTTYTDDVDTLVSLYEFCNKNPNYKVLYFTNLGVTQDTLNKSGWRLMLQYFNIDKWKECIDLLESYDCVGAEGHFGVIDNRPGVGPDTDTLYVPHYSGNWWWATSKYINSLNIEYISRNIKDRIRERAEAWIATKSDVKYFNWYSTGHYGGLYEHYALPTDYMNCT